MDLSLEKYTKIHKTPLSVLVCHRSVKKSSELIDTTKRSLIVLTRSYQV